MYSYFSPSDICNLFSKLAAAESQTLRCKFIQRFCDTGSNYYKNYLYYGGGYQLWSCMPRGAEEVTVSDLRDAPLFEGDVFLFWDYYNPDDEMWKIGRESIIKLDFNDFLDNIEKFPQDSYVFDKNLKHALVNSHEGYTNGEQFLWLYGNNSGNNSN